MTVYRIRDWKQNFESYEQTRLKAKDGMRWVTITTKHDGKTFGRLALLEDAAAIYGAWILMVAVAGKCPERGVLADQDGPLTAEDLAIKTKFPIAVFERALAVLSSERFKWIEIVEDAGIPAGCAGIPDDQRESTPTLPHITSQDITSHNRTSQGGAALNSFDLPRNTKAKDLLTPAGAQMVFERALAANACTASERLNVFRFICSLAGKQSVRNIPGAIIGAIRDGKGADPWKACGCGDETAQQAKEWIRSLEVPPEMQKRSSDLATGPPNAEQQKQEFKAKHGLK